MNRESALLAAAVALTAVTTVGTLAAPGAVSNPAAVETVEPPGHAGVSEVTFAASEITGGTATLSVDTYLAHGGGDVENVTVVHRATDTETGLVEATAEIPVGDLEGEADPVERPADREGSVGYRAGPVGDDAEHRVPGEIDLPREGDYRLETIVYADDSRIETVEGTLEGVGSLTPTYAETDVDFHRFGREYGYGPSVLPAIQFAVDETDGDAVTLTVRGALTNSGDDPEGDLELEVVARQSDSNVVADVASVDPGTIGAGETARPTVELTVPEGYDYFLDATLWKGGSVVGTERAAANIGPGELTVDDASAESGLEVGDFASDGGVFDGDDGDGAGADDDGDHDGQPGFGLGIGLAAVLLAALLARRYGPRPDAADGRATVGPSTDRTDRSTHDITDDQ